MVEEDPAITDLDRAVDVLVEMKNISEVAVGLAYSALLFNDQSLAAEVSTLEDRLDEMRERLEVWVLRSAADELDPSPLRGLLHLGGGRRGDRRRRAADGLARRGGRGDAPRPRDGARRLRRGDRAGPGRTRLAARRRDAARGAARGRDRLLPARDPPRRPVPVPAARRRCGSQAGDELIASGPDEGQALLAERCGYRLVEDDDTGEIELVPRASAAGNSTYAGACRRAQAGAHAADAGRRAGRRRREPDLDVERERAGLGDDDRVAVHLGDLGHHLGEPADAQEQVLERVDVGRRACRGSRTAAATTAASARARAASRSVSGRMPQRGVAGQLGGEPAHAEQHERAERRVAG